jgi:hypothetical protein
MKPKVYIETTIPSFYYEVRTEPDMVARRQWTREWWDDCRQNYEVVTSVAVIGELEKGNYPQKEEACRLIAPLTLVAVELDVTNLVDIYIRHRVMPNDPTGDALHLALASYYRCDFLLTWNCRHLANANKFEHIRRINMSVGVSIPLLITPLALLGGREDGKGRSGNSMGS